VIVCLKQITGSIDEDEKERLTTSPSGILEDVQGILRGGGVGGVK
jgi:hypothetical protein